MFWFIDGPTLVCGWVNFPILWPHTPVQRKLKCPPGVLNFHNRVDYFCRWYDVAMITFMVDMIFASLLYLKLIIPCYLLYLKVIVPC